MENSGDSNRLAEICHALISKRHGIITQLIEEPENPDARGLFIFNSLTVEASYFRDNRRANQQDARNGSGAAFDRKEALWATIGETLERYSAFVFDPGRLVYASQNELGVQAVPLSDFILFAPEQYEELDFPFSPPDSNMKQYWVEATDQADRTLKKWVPATMIFLGMRLRDMRENIAQSTSTGLACAQNDQSALRSGMSEVVERDAFSAMWQLSYAPPKLRIDQVTRERLHPKVARILDQKRTNITLWNITTDLDVPTVMCLTENANSGMLAFGSATNPDPIRAINKAVIESLHGLVWSYHIKRRNKPYPAEHEIKTPTDHFSYYLDTARRPILDFLFKNDTVMDAADLPPNTTSMDDVVLRLADKGYRTYAVDVTTRDVCAIGLRVMRILIPGLQPLLFGHRMVSLDRRRLEKIAAYWRLPSLPTANPFPHPFP